MERKKRRLVGKFGGDRKSDQDLESGLVVFDEQERAISLVHQHANGANPKQSTHCLHNIPTHASNQAAINTCPVGLCFGVLFNQPRKEYAMAKRQTVGKECATCRCSSLA
jgi:hypothetical protein